MFVIVYSMIGIALMVAFMAKVQLLFGFFETLNMYCAVLGTNNVNFLETKRVIYSNLLYNFVELIFFYSKLLV